jgi:hypothetical protein
VQTDDIADAVELRDARGSHVAAKQQPC